MGPILRNRSAAKKEAEVRKVLEDKTNMPRNRSRRTEAQVIKPPAEKKAKPCVYNKESSNENCENLTHDELDVYDFVGTNSPPREKKKKRKPRRARKKDPVTDTSDDDATPMKVERKNTRARQKKPASTEKKKVSSTEISWISVIPRVDEENVTEGREEEDEETETVSLKQKGNKTVINSKIEEKRTRGRKKNPVLSEEENAKVVKSKGTASLKSEVTNPVRKTNRNVEESQNGTRRRKVTDGKVNGNIIEKKKAALLVPAVENPVIRPKRNILTDGRQTGVKGRRKNCASSEEDDGNKIESKSVASLKQEQNPTIKSKRNILREEKQTGIRGRERYPASSEEETDSMEGKKKPAILKQGDHNPVIKSKRNVLTEQQADSRERQRNCTSDDKENGNIVQRNRVALFKTEKENLVLKEGKENDVRGKKRNPASSDEDNARANKKTTPLEPSETNPVKRCKRNILTEGNEASFKVPLPVVEKASESSDEGMLPRGVEPVSPDEGNRAIGANSTMSENKENSLNSSYKHQRSLLGFSPIEHYDKSQYITKRRKPVRVTYVDDFTVENYFGFDEESEDELNLSIALPSRVPFTTVSSTPYMKSLPTRIDNQLSMLRLGPAVGTYGTKVLPFPTTASKSSKKNTSSSLSSNQRSITSYLTVEPSIKQTASTSFPFSQSATPGAKVVNEVPKTESIPTTIDKAHTSARKPVPEIEKPMSIEEAVSAIFAEEKVDPQFTKPPRHSYERPVRLRRQSHSEAEADSMSEDEVCHKKLSKQNKKHKVTEDKRAEKWAANVSAQFEEIESFELCVE